MNPHHIRITQRHVLQLANVHTYGSKYRHLNTSTSQPENRSCRILVVGGGSGGCSVAAKFASKLGKGKVIVVEPADLHYYQPLLTLVGGGVYPVSKCARKMQSVLPTGATWIKDEVISFHPHENSIETKTGSTIKYDFLVLALGLTLNFDKVKGLQSALETPGSGVCSNYSPKYAEKTFKELQAFTKGDAIFTCPSTVIKCGGAPQKIAYLAEHYLRKSGKRKDANMIFRTGGVTLFPSPYYEEALYPVAKKRNIKVELKQDLVAVDVTKKTACFKNMDTSEEKDIKYDFMHVTPPQGPPLVLSQVKDLVDAGGWVNVNRDTLQHVKFPNIFSIGDCSNLPTSKTAAAVAGQCGVLSRNLSSAMEGKPLTAVYDGYTSCPLVTGYNSLILAEFDYDKKPLETFPIDQRKESALMYNAKRYVLPAIYWNFMLRGWWDGPSAFRRFIKY